MSLRELLFCDPPRSIPHARAVQVAGRSVHIAGMGLVLGGIAYGAPDPALEGPFAVTIASGLLLLGVDLARSFRFLGQGAGLAFLAKMALICLGRSLPSVRVELYLAATVVASIGSHMSRSWRHHDLFRRP